MTEQELRDRFVKSLGAYYGAEEGSERHRELIDWYNRLSPLPRGYRMTYTADWCVAVAVAIAVKLELTDIVFPECSCTKEIELYNAAGRFTKDKHYRPQPGDFLIFDWNPGSGPDHWATVVRVTGSTIRTIEGNLGDKIWHRDVEIGDERIYGYCLPDYAGKAAKLTKPNRKFQDVPEGKWYTKPIEKAAELGLMAGVSETEFGLGQPVNREELAAVAVRLYECLKPEQQE